MTYLDEIAPPKQSGTRSKSGKALRVMGLIVSAPRRRRHRDRRLRAEGHEADDAKFQLNVEVSSGESPVTVNFTTPDAEPAEKPAAVPATPSPPSEQPVLVKPSDLRKIIREENTVLADEFRTAIETVKRRVDGLEVVLRNVVADLAKVKADTEKKQADQATAIQHQQAALQQQQADAKRRAEEAAGREAELLRKLDQAKADAESVRSRAAETKIVLTAKVEPPLVKWDTRLGVAPCGLRFLNLLNDTNWTAPRCPSCGKEYLAKLVGDGVATVPK